MMLTTQTQTTRSLLLTALLGRPTLAAATWVLVGMALSRPCVASAQLAVGQAGEEGEVEVVIDEDEPQEEGEGIVSEEGPGAEQSEAPGASPTPGAPSEGEIASFRTLYESFPKEEQGPVIAYYRDLGVDLDKLLGISTAAMAAAQRLQETIGALGQMDFSRTPANVLGARAELGFGRVPHPNPDTAPGASVARWLYLQVMAGDWSEVASFLDGRPPAEAQALYSRILQSLNSPKSELLPEEVLAVAELCPEDPKAWQTSAWASMLRGACSKNSPEQVLARIREGSTFFGAGDAIKRRRTIDLLASAGLVREAQRYLMPLEEARAAGDGDLVLVHAMYQADLADRAGDSPEARMHRDAAWDLFCEASLMGRTSMQGRKEAIRQAIGLMSSMPRSKVTPWLERVFADDALGTAALESIVLRAAAVGQGDSNAGVPRAEAIVTLKEAVDVLLEQKGADLAALRVPLRMLTTSVVSEMEASSKTGRADQIESNAQILLRAIPSHEWFDALEQSVASRATKASIAIAVLADETDMALGLVSDGVARSPEEAPEIGEFFLEAWEGKLHPQSSYDDDEMMYYFWRQYVPSAPLTRGRQRRNLERLARLMDTLGEAGVEARELPGIAGAFKACHGISEVYERADIERVFGPVEDIPPGTAAGLAATMAASLNGDWRNRAVLRENGVNRTDSEIAQLVDKGYAVAIDLIDSAIARNPDSWRYAVVKAGLTFDRLQFNAEQQSTDDPAKRAEYRAAAFAAFEKAAQRYSRALASGDEREDASVYERWFGAVMGTSQLNFLRAEDMPDQGTPEDDQVERIRRAIAMLPPDVASRILAEFARDIVGAVSRSDPEVKPKLVKQGLRVVGDHPAGAALRSLDELYRDLVKDEIKLRLAVDGDEQVGEGRQFGVLLSLRFTNAVDRETGGFSKYLQNNVWVRVGRQYQEVNFQEKLQKTIEESLGKGFEVESVGFFDPFMPSRGIIEGGEGGWMEKPMAYVVLSRTDPTVDRIPQITLDMQFEDQTGPVTLVLPSNTPLVATGAGTTDAAPARTAHELKVTQTVDPRDARDREKDRAIRLEVTFRGQGAVPDLRDVLTGLDDAMEGYEIKDGGIEAAPTNVVQEGDPTASSYYSYGPHKAPEGGYPEPDEHGIYRLPVERSWTLTYTPSAGTRGALFRLPRLRAGVAATLESSYYSDYDLVPATGETIPIRRRSLWRYAVLSGAGLVVIIAGVMVYLRRRGEGPGEAPDVALPEHVTPLTAVMTLRRIAEREGAGLDAQRRSELERDIAAIEMKYFGPGENPEPNSDLTEALRRWVSRTAAG